MNAPSSFAIGRDGYVCMPWGRANFQRARTRCHCCARLQGSMGAECYLFPAGAPSVQASVKRHVCFG
jgi:hypothetical protein